MLELDREGRRRKMLPLVDAAKVLGRTYQSLHNDVLKGRIAGEKVDGRWYVAASAIRSLRRKRSKANSVEKSDAAIAD